MATRTRHSVPGKEKRGTSPSYKPQTGGTPERRSSPSSPARQRNSTTTPTKNVPNYLKPTISSGNDVSKQLGKKTVSSPALIRRRSFDKPPSPSHTPKHVSPVPPLRSSSFSGKTLTSQKVGPDKTLKGQRDAGKQHSMFGATKKNNLSMKKREIEYKSDVSEPEVEAEDKISILTEKKELTRQEESNNEERVLIQEDQDMEITIQQTETEAALGVKPEETEDKLQNDETDTNERELKWTESDENVNEPEEKELEESTAMDEIGNEGSRNEKEIKLQEMAEEENKLSENTEPEERQEIENAVPEERQRMESASPEERQETENAQLEERQKTENTAPEEKQETETASIEGKQEIIKSPREEETERVPPQMAHGKKDLQVAKLLTKPRIAVSNDVIEETANKLREQRKNKVRALAGAFETVISLQETK